METSAERELIDYGIHNEASNIRAHVAPLAKTLFVFPTRCAVGIMSGFKKVPAYQAGVDGKTAEGYLVPPLKIPYIRSLAIRDSRLAGFTEDIPLLERGNRAVEIVSAFLKMGHFPLWLEGEFVTDQQIQVTGTDMVVRGKWNIEVKCDFRASVEWGKPHPRCTGHLFLQIAERNPRKLH